MDNNNKNGSNQNNPNNNDDQNKKDNKVSLIAAIVATFFIFLFVCWIRDQVEDSTRKEITYTDLLHMVEDDTVGSVLFLRKKKAPDDVKGAVTK